MLTKYSMLLAIQKSKLSDSTHIETKFYTHENNISVWWIGWLWVIEFLYIDQNKLL